MIDGADSREVVKAGALNLKSVNLMAFQQRGNISYKPEWTRVFVDHIAAYEGNLGVNPGLRSFGCKAEQRR